MIQRQLLSVCLFVLIAAINSCKKNQEDQAPLSITAVDPGTARAGDTITIEGTGFIARPSQNAVLFTSSATGELNVEAKVVETAGKFIKVIVPQGVQTGKIAVEVLGITRQLDFTYDASERPFYPILVSVDPSHARTGTEVEITLDLPRDLRQDDSVEVRFGELIAEALKDVHRKTLKVKVPVMPDGPVTIQVTLNGMAATSGLSFTIDPVPAVKLDAWWVGYDENFTPQIFEGKFNAGTQAIRRLYEGQVFNPRGVTVDKTGGYLYWTEGDAIMRATLDNNGSIETLFASYDGIPENSGLATPMDIVLEVSSQHIYFADRSYTGEHFIYRGSMTGGALTKLYSLGSTPGGSVITGLKIAGTNLYWAEPESKRVMKAPLDGSAAPVELFKSANMPNNVAIDLGGQKIFVVEVETLPDFSTVYQIVQRNINGSGASVVLRSGAGSVSDMETDNEFLYFLTITGEQGDLLRAPLDGSGDDIIISDNILYGSYFHIISD